MTIPSEQPITTEPIENTVAQAPVPSWALHRKLYNWMVSFADHPRAAWALFWLSFAESSFFPIPPDVLLLPMCLGRRARAFWYAFVTTAASVLGAFLGYAIGYYVIEAALKYIPMISQEKFDSLAAKFNDNGEMYVFVAALTPIPFKLVTIFAGSAKMSLLLFLVACIVGRSARFFCGAALVWWIGPAAKPLIEKYFNWACVAAAILVGIAYYVYKALSGH